MRYDHAPIPGTVPAQAAPSRAPCRRSWRRPAHWPATRAPSRPRRLAASAAAAAARVARERRRAAIVAARPGRHERVERLAPGRRRRAADEEDDHRRDGDQRQRAERQRRARQRDWTWARGQGSASPPPCPAIPSIPGGIRTGAAYNGPQEWRRRLRSPPARPAGSPHDRRTVPHRAQLARAQQRAAPRRHRRVRPAAVDAPALVPRDRQRARGQEPAVDRRLQERVRRLLVRRGGDLRRRRRGARPAVGARGAQGLPPARAATAP